MKASGILDVLVICMRNHRGNTSNTWLSYIRYQHTWFRITAQTGAHTSVHMAGAGRKTVCPS